MEFHRQAKSPMSLKIIPSSQPLLNYNCSIMEKSYNTYAKSRIILELRNVGVYYTNTHISIIKNEMAFPHLKLGR